MQKLISLITPGLLAALILGLSLSTQAGPNGYYRWTDENGVVKNADIPPEGVDATFIRFSVQKASKTDGTKVGKNGTGKTDQADLGDLEILPEKDPALCKQAQRNLKALEGTRIRMTEPDGSKRLITEDEKETQRSNARKFIKLHCD